MGRIKITGYINTADLSHDELDDSHPSGLSSHGYDKLLGHEGNLKISDLEDVDAEAERE